MSIVSIQSDQESRIVLDFVKSSINREIARLEIAMQLARKRLMPFEQKYGVPSEHFYLEMVAEDLEGGDDEYVQWAGEYRLMQRLEQKLHHLQGMTYYDNNLC